MKLIGWGRDGDRTACGGIVIEGDQTCISYGRAYTYQGAIVSCRKQCFIAEGFQRATVIGGAQVIHGMKTSGGCPIYSTLNDIDGVLNESGQEIPVRFVKNDAGDWIGKMNEGYDQHFVLTDDVTGEILTNRHYRMTLNGKTVEGKTNSNGETQRVTFDDPAEVTIEVMREGYQGEAKA